MIHLRVFTRCKLLANIRNLAMSFFPALAPIGEIVSRIREKRARSLACICTTIPDYVARVSAKLKVIINVNANPQQCVGAEHEAGSALDGFLEHRANGCAKECERKDTGQSRQDGGKKE